MRKSYLRHLSFWLFMASPVCLQALEALDDHALSAVTGQDGVHIELNNYDSGNFGLWVEDPDGTIFEPTGAFMGFDSLRLAGSIQMDVDVGSTASNDPQLVVDAVVTVDDPFNMGQLTFSTGPMGTGSTAPMLNFISNDLDYSPIHMRMELGTESPDQGHAILVTQGELGYWSGTMQMLDNDGIAGGGGAAVGNFDIQFGTDEFVDSIDLAGLSFDITSQGLKFNMPAVSGLDILGDNIYFGDPTKSALTLQLGGVNIQNSSVTITGKDYGLVMIGDFGDADFGYIRWVDPDGAEGVTNPHGVANPSASSRNYYNNTYNTLADCEGANAAESACGAIRLDNVRMTGDLKVLFDLANANGIPRWHFDVDLTGFTLTGELLNGFDLNSKAGSWGNEVRLTNFENAKMDIEIAFTGNHGGGPDVAGSGLTLYGAIKDAAEFDIEIQGDVGTLPTDNTVALQNISPAGSDLVFGDINTGEAMTFDIDATEGWIIKMPVIRGSLEIGSLGPSGGGILLNGEQAARVLFDEWVLDPGTFKITAH